MFRQIVLTLGLVGGMAAPAIAETSFMLGGGAIYAPEYEGGDEYEFSFLPLVEAEWKRDDYKTHEGISLHQAKLGFDGLSATWLKLDAKLVTYTSRIGVGYDFGRDAGDSDALTGLGDIDGYASPFVTFGVQARNGLGLDAKYETALSDDDNGSLVTLGTSWFLPVSKTVFFRPSANVVWASEDHMQRYFGINARQAANSVYNQFTPDSGFKSMGAGVMVNWNFWGNANLMVSGNAKQLLGDAADSPIVDGPGSDTQFSLLTGLSWRF